MGHAVDMTYIMYSERHGSQIISYVYVLGELASTKIDNGIFEL